MFDGISGTWLRQMSYSMCRFWAYDESKKLLGAGKDAPAWKLAAAGSMGASFSWLCWRAGPALMADCATTYTRSWRYCRTSGEPRRCVDFSLSGERRTSYILTQSMQKL